MTAEPNTISNFDDERLIREGEAAVDGYNKDMKNARARIMPMARGLLAAKRKYPATLDFGDWLKTSSYREVGDTDRAALIHIGEHDMFAEKFMRTTSLMSPQTIWDAIRDLMPSSYDRNSTAVVHNIVQQPQTATVLPEKPTTPVQNEPRKDRSAPVQVRDTDPLSDMRRVSEVLAIFTQQN